jgi:leader peptidase (prepilin peptidase)/N-methyltransferase
MERIIIVYWAVCAFVLGAVVGSFLNVVIWRLPREESLATPGSHCLRCGSPIRWHDNIPILSYLLLLGRCRDCGAGISPRYPLIELVNACLSLALYLRWGLTPAFGVYFLLCSAMVAVFWIDIDHMIIPDSITLNGLPVGVAFATTGLIPGMDWRQSLIGLVMGGAVLYIPAVIYERLRGIEGVGGGDVKLLAMVGTFVGPIGVVFVLFCSSATGVLGSVPGILMKRFGSTSPIPFGPFLSSATVAYVLIGPEIVETFIRSLMQGLRMHG